MTYHVYENWTIKKAKIHRSDCSYCKHGAGIHPKSSKINGRWHGPFASHTEAQNVAVSTGQPVSLCQVCGPE